MATLKTSPANLLAFFERKSNGRDVDGGIEPTTVSANDTHENEVHHNGADLGVEVKKEVDIMVQVVWERLIHCLNGCNTNVMETLFCCSHDSVNKGSVNVAREIFRREIMNIVDNAYDSVMEKNRVGRQLSEDECKVNSMKRRISEMEEEVIRAGEALRLERKERYYVQFERDDYEQKYSKLSSAAFVWRKERKDLREENDMLLKKSQQLELENEKLREEKNRNEMKALQAEHNAEMARLVATQSGLQAQSLHKQLRESKRMVSAISERVEELQRVQDDLREELCTADRSNRYSRHRVECLLRKSSAIHGFFGSRLSRRRLEIHSDGDERGAGQAEGKSHREDERSEDEAIEKAVKDTTAKSTEKRDELVAGTLHKLVRRLRVLKSTNSTNNTDTAANQIPPHNQHDVARIAHRASKNKNMESNRNEQGAAASRSRLGTLRRILSSTSSGRREQKSEGIRSASRTYKALESLETNLAAWRELVHEKYAEVERRHAELRAAVEQSDKFEKRLCSEQRERLIAKYKSDKDRGQVGQCEDAEEDGMGYSFRTF
eukprot:TRINITY_DN1424_c0_g1_i3.p1 TRINITY_DN1424_c0_g1~~TRINITY_DN1424_c0_g1_i3.p1  ORF type:complete len:550 (+),score=96.47 TRINITY_DN1424_c0_g1_i3:3248-4897(+)